MHRTAKTILVTGAAGFIGSHVAESLLRRGDSVVGLDNFNDYYDPARKRSNVAEVRRALDDAARFEVIEGDIRDRSLISGIFVEHRFDAVVHLAAMAGVTVSIHDPHLYYDVDLIGTLNLLDAARDHAVGNVVFASTSSVYGRSSEVPFLESDSCDRPLAPYPASKRGAEMLCFTYHHLYGQNVSVVRFFSVYGPRGRPDMMAYKVLDNIFFEREVPLYNGGRMHRDWTYVEDIVSGVVAATDRPLGYEIINLGRGEPVLLADFVHLIESLTGRRANLKPAPMLDADISYTYASIDKARTLLGYQPHTSVPDGVERFWEWYRGAVLRGDGEV